MSGELKFCSLKLLKSVSNSSNFLMKSSPELSSIFFVVGLSATILERDGSIPDENVSRVDGFCFEKSLEDELDEASIDDGSRNKLANVVANALDEDPFDDELED